MSLDGVKVEDRPRVRSVIDVIEKLGKCKGWHVRAGVSSYEVTAYLPDKAADTVFTLEELDLIQRVDDLRVKAGFKAIGGTGKAAVSIVVLMQSEAVNVEEYTIERVRKRSRFWGLLGY